MSIPTNAVSTELDAVNQILSSVGQAPVTTLDMQNPEVSIVLITLREVSRQVQSEGWLFNTEQHVRLQPNPNTKKIKYPPNAISLDSNVDIHGDKYNLVRRAGYLYDLYSHSFLFDDNVDVDVVWMLPFDEIEPIAQQYIIARTAKLCAVKMVGDTEIYQLLTENENNTRVALVEHDAAQGDFNMFGLPEGNRAYKGYEPFTALIR